MITAIIQARMGSTRLPGKVLMKVNGRPLLDYMIERVKASHHIQQVIIATTRSIDDAPIVDWCKTKKVLFYRGDEEHVLSRYYEAAREYKASLIVRMTSDCPLMDARVIDEVIQAFLDRPQVNFVSNTVPLPCLYPDGMDVEVFSFDLLKQAYTEARLPSEQEHVTFYMWKTGKFKTWRVDYPMDLSMYRFTVDYPQDFKLVKAVLENLYPLNPAFSMQDLIVFVDAQPGLREAQAGIKRNAGWQKAFDKDQESLTKLRK